jgi:hypothetical protein
MIIRPVQTTSTGFGSNLSQGSVQQPKRKKKGIMGLSTKWWTGRRKGDLKETQAPPC